MCMFILGKYERMRMAGPDVALVYPYILILWDASGSRLAMAAQVASNLVLLLIFDPPFPF